MTGSQLVQAVNNGKHSLNNSSLSQLRKMARALALCVSDGKRYYRRDELISAIAYKLTGPVIEPKGARK